jgi:hypothetical protein
MDAKTPSGGRDRTMVDQGFPPRRRGRSIRGTLAEPGLRGMTPFQWNASLGRLRTSPYSTCHPASWTFLEADWAAVPHLHVGEAPGGLTFCSWMSHLP